jgi:hypothetical protein
LEDQTSTKENSIAGGGAPGVGTASPINIGVNCELSWGGARNEKTVAEGALEITKNPLCCGKVELPRSMHVKADLLDSICNVGPSEGKVLKGTGKAAISCRVCNRRSSISGDLGTSVDGCGAGLAITHAVASKNVKSVLPLGEVQMVLLVLNNHAEEMM